MIVRILHIPHAYAPVVGGAEIHCQRVSESLAEKGHDVRVATSNVGSVEAYYELGEPRVEAQAEIINRVEVRRFPFCGELYQSASAWVPKLPSRRIRARARACVLQRIGERFRQHLLREIADFQPEVVMTMPHLVVNVECVLQVHQVLRFPLVMAPLLHENWSEPLRQRMQAALRQANAVVANTSIEAERLQTDYGVPGDKIFTAWLGVDLPDSDPERPREPQVLFLGRKVPEKGIHSLIAAMQFVWNECPKAKLVLAGVRSTKTADIDKMIAALAERDRRRTVSLDNITPGQKSELLSTCCCLVLPSANESFGMVLLEAMAHRTPVIALDRPVFRDVVDDGEDGILVSPNDIRGMAGAILRLLRNRDTATRMGQKGYRKVTERFTWDRVAERYLEAYEHAIAARTDSRQKAIVEGNA